MQLRQKKQNMHAREKEDEGSREGNDAKNEKGKSEMGHACH